VYPFLGLKPGHEPRVRRVKGRQCCRDVDVHVNRHDTVDGTTSYPLRFRPVQHSRYQSCDQVKEFSSMAPYGGVSIRCRGALALSTNLAAGPLIRARGTVTKSKSTVKDSVSHLTTMTWIMA
jgi:hypothetical protein